MKVHFAIVALMAITWLPLVIPQRYPHYITHPNNRTKTPRQTSADQMVHNILQWLQGSSSDSIRKVRQDGLRTYLPPITHTQKPRPFEPAPPEDNNIVGFPPSQPAAPPGISPPHAPGYIEQPENPYPQPEEPRYPDGFTESELSPGLNEIPGLPDDSSIHPGPQGPSLVGTTPPSPNEYPIYSSPSPTISPGDEHPSYTEGQTNPPQSTTTHTVTEGVTYPQKETPHPSFPLIDLPSGSQELPESSGYPPAGSTPQPPFPPISSSSEGYPPAGSTSEAPIPPIFSTSSPQSPPEITGYPPAGATPQPPFLIPNAPGEEETSYPSPADIPSTSQETIVPTGYPPARETPQPPFEPSHIPDKTKTPSPPEEGIPDYSTSQPPIPPEVTGYPSFGETSKPSFELPTSGEPIAPDQEHEQASTPGQTDHTTTSTFPPFVRETASPELPSVSETETSSPITPASPPNEENPLPETPPRPTFPEVNSSPPTLETTSKEEISQPQLPEVNPTTPQTSETQPSDSSATEVHNLLPSQSPLPSNEPGGDETESQEPKVTSPDITSEDDLKHPPHIHTIDVECAKDMMTINIEFNRQFDGVIYSKGFYNDPECRYVNENSGLAKYTFTVKLNSCGTQFVNAFDTENQSYLENILVLQNEVGIQEVWDTIRSVRCLWEGNLSRSLTVSLSVGMLSEEIVTFSGDTAIARLDIQRGEGPFAPSANGLVPIGEKMTLVISVTGDPGFDIQVKECKAKDATEKLEYSLTDENGCILRPKLFGSFQKTRNTRNSGASIIAYAFFNAFKFPDLMDLMIECNVELCKTDCDVCPDPNEKLQPGKRRRRDLYNETIGEPVKVGRYLKVLLPQDLSEGEVIVPVKKLEENKICLSVRNFVAASVLLISLVFCSFFCSIYVLLRRRPNYYKHQQ